MACQLDSHPQAGVIESGLRSGASLAEINALLRQGDANHKDIPMSTMSRHRTACLGLPKANPGRNPATRITQADVDAVGDDEVTGEEVKNLALKNFYARLKKNPADVGMKELVSVISALSRAGAGGKSAKSALDEAMSDLDD